MRCGVGCRCGSDLTLLWLWYRPAAVALIGPLAWEPAYASGAALKIKKKKKKSQQTTNAEDVIEKREPFCSVGGNLNW